MCISDGQRTVTAWKLTEAVPAGTPASFRLSLRDAWGNALQPQAGLQTARACLHIITSWPGTACLSQKRVQGAAHTAVACRLTRCRQAAQKCMTGRAA